MELFKWLLARGALLLTAVLILGAAAPAQASMQTPTYKLVVDLHDKRDICRHDVREITVLVQEDTMTPSMVYIRDIPGVPVEGSADKGALVPLRHITRASPSYYMDGSSVDDAAIFYYTATETGTVVLTFRAVTPAGVKSESISFEVHNCNPAVAMIYQDYVVHSGGGYRYLGAMDETVLTPEGEGTFSGTGTLIGGFTLTDVPECTGYSTHATPIGMTASVSEEGMTLDFAPDLIIAQGGGQCLGIAGEGTREVELVGLNALTIPESGGIASVASPIGAGSFTIIVTRAAEGEPVSDQGAPISLLAWLDR